MPAGTIDLTNGSNKVSGSGTSFTTELKAGDFMYVNVGGAPYTIVASAVVSDIEITLTEAFTGPTSTGLSWNSVPALLQMAITQKVINDFAQVARGRILDFENWQGIYSDEPSVTVTRPDRTQYTGPSWGHIAKVVGAVEDPLTNLVPLSRQYMTLAAAQADIVNIPDGSATFVRSSDDESLAIEYINTGGVLTDTGRKMPSKQAIDEVYSLIADNITLSLGSNIYNYRSANDGKYLNEQGIVSDNAIYFLSDYIPVSASVPYVSNYSLRFVHFMDANKNILSFLTYQTQFTTPEHTAFIRITGGMGSKELLQIESGTLKTKFKKYNKNVSSALLDGTPISIRNAMGIGAGKNLFDKSVATQGYAINETGALIVASTYCVSDYINVKTGDLLQPSQSVRYGNFYDKNKKWLSSIQNQNIAFSVPESAVYVRVTVLLARIDYFQLELGSEMTVYEPYSLKAASALDGDNIKYPVHEPDIYSIGLFSSGKNIFNPYTLVAGYIDENGFVAPGGASYKFSDYLPVKASTAYTGNKSMRFVSFYDTRKAFISTITSVTTLSTPTNAAFVRVTLAVANIDRFQLEEGTSNTDYVAFSYAIKGKLPNGEPVEVGSSVAPEERVPDSFGLERLRETHQRLNKLSFSATGLTARLTWAMIGDSYTRDSSRYPLRCARRLWSLYQSGAANVSSGPIGWGYLSFGGADTASSQNGSVVNPSAVIQSGFVGTYYGGDSPDISVMQSSTAGSTLSWSE